MVVFLFIISIGLFLFAYLVYKVQSNKAEFAKTNKTVLNDKLVNTSGFVSSVNITGQLSRYVFAVDDKNNEIVYIDNNTTKRIKYKDIVCVEMIEDGKTVSSHSATRTIGGAIIGSALFGTGGAIVGGMSGKTTTSKIISTIKVKILLNDVIDNNIVIECFNSFFVIKNTDLQTDIKNGMSHAKQIVDIITVIIDKNKQKDNVVPDKYDEITKLNALKTEGIITQAEFEEQKTKILNK